MSDSLLFRHQTRARAAAGAQALAQTPVRRVARALALVFPLLLTLALLALAPMPVSAGQPAVKMSSSGICHDPSSPWYGRTTNYTAYDSLEECLREGRLPRGHTPQAGGTPAPRTPDATGSGYDRDAFGDWIDSDRDCQNTRHELLAALSTGRVRLSEDGCRVVHGRWLDPYTNRVYTSARDLDVDHLVPLAWAWPRGADTWTPATRERFANDPVNLFAVQASANRSKGARGPLDWLPPHDGFHCQYVLRFERVMRVYGLRFLPGERQAFTALKTRTCS